MSLKLKPTLLNDLVMWVVGKGGVHTRKLLTPTAGQVLAFDANSIPASEGPQIKEIVGAGTAYTLTATAAAVDLGTTDPVLPALDKAGTYLIMGWAVLNYVGATFAADRTFTLKLRRTNNTATDLTGGAAALGSGITTTVTQSRVVPLPPTIYTTSRTDDVINLFADVSVLPTAGSVTIGKAQLVAIRVR
jgi:hypothetical protein